MPPRLIVHPDRHQRTGTVGPQGARCALSEAPYVRFGRESNADGLDSSVSSDAFHACPAGLLITFSRDLLDLAVPPSLLQATARNLASVSPYSLDVRRAHV